jgi:hypothetical protein
MAASRQLRPPLQAATVETIVGLLALSGLQVSEMIRLTNSDVDFEQGSLVVRDSKNHTSRTVPLHSSTPKALPPTQRCGIGFSRGPLRQLLRLATSFETRLVREGHRPRHRRTARTRPHRPNPPLQLPTQANRQRAITWALTRHPRHPQLVNGQRLPPGWLPHAQRHQQPVPLTSPSLPPSAGHP